MNKKTFGTICFYLGLVSVAASVVAFRFCDKPPEAYAVMFGIWASTFLILSDRLKN